MKQLSDTDGNLAELQVTAAGLASRVSSNEGDISQLEQTAQGLSSRVGDAEGAVAKGPCSSFAALRAASDTNSRRRLVRVLSKLFCVSPSPLCAGEYQPMERSRV